MGSSTSAAFLLTTLFLFNITPTRADISIHYYKDLHCAEYNTAFHPFESACYNYGVAGTRSAGADTWSMGGKLSCTFFSEYDCKGAADTQHERGCSSSLKQYKSVLCLPGV